MSPQHSVTNYPQDLLMHHVRYQPLPPTCSGLVHIFGCKHCEYCECGLTKLINYVIGKDNDGKLSRS